MLFLSTNLPNSFAVKQGTSVKLITDIGLKNTVNLDDALSALEVWRRSEKPFRARNGTYNIELSCVPFQYKQFITTAYSHSSVGNLEKCLKFQVLSEVPVHKTDEVWELLERGSRARSVGSTNANEFSSRSPV
ncbi:kinesin-like protein KIN-14S [Tanacetum coccineum]